MRRAENITTLIRRLSGNLGASTSLSLWDLSRSVQRLLNNTTGISKCHIEGSIIQIPSYIYIYIFIYLFIFVDSI